MEQKQEIGIEKTLFIITENIKKIRDDQKKFNYKLDKIFNRLFVTNGSTAIVVEIDNIKNDIKKLKYSDLDILKKYNDCPAKKITLKSKILEGGKLAGSVTAIITAIYLAIKFLGI